MGNNLVSNDLATGRPAALAHDSKFTFVIVKPTHYDDDGYPIQWFRSAIPSNTLACLNGLAEDARRRQVLGPGVEIDFTPTTKPIGACGPTGSSATSSAVADGR